MKLAFRRGGRGWRLALALLALLAACKKEEAPELPPPDVQVQVVEQRDVPVYHEWVGTMSGFINAAIKPQVKGYLLTKNYTEGSVVAANQLLFQIDPREFQAQLDQAVGNLQQAQAALGKTQLDVARYTPLAKEGAVSQQELDNAVQANEANIAAVAAAKAAVEQARLNLGWTKVVSPIAGVSGIAIAQIGDLVEPTTTLTTVSTLDPIKVIFPVSEQEYLRYAKGRAKDEGEQASRRDGLELINADETVYRYRGSVSVIGREIEVRTGTLTLEALFPNPDNLLRPGGYAKIRAVIETKPNAIVVSQRAVQNLQGQYQVTVVGPDDTVEIRNVSVGPRTHEDWVITEGLQKGERVVVEGFQKVRPGMKVAVQPYVPEKLEATPWPTAATPPTLPPVTPPAG
ncbi:MAG: efflux RND transporter periplasmic adaptor subunit [Deltaproteobacteria bacterium]|nr:efflux RND transporter periplasmic adaptor subunit [Deltaproteobacteria bacterium]